MTGADCARLPGERPRPRRLSALALVVLATIQLVTASGADLAHDPVALLTAVLGVTGLLTALRLGTAGCIESRIATAILATAALLGLALTHTLGAPGAAPSAWTLRDALLGAVALGLAGAAFRPSRQSARTLWRR